MWKTPTSDENEDSFVWREDEMELLLEDIRRSANARRSANCVCFQKKPIQFLSPTGKQVWNLQQASFSGDRDG